MTHRTPKSLFTLIVVIVMSLLILSGCAQSGGKAAQICPKNANFCASWPIAKGDKLTSYTYITKDGAPPFTEYLTRLPKGDDVEQYVVGVYDYTPAQEDRLMQSYQQGWDCAVDPQLAFKAKVCANSEAKSGNDTTWVTMLVHDEKFLYLVEANSGTLEEPSQGREFIRSFQPNP